MPADCKGFVWRSKGTYLIFFHFVINGFNDFGIFFFEKRNKTFTQFFIFFFFNYLLHSRINERSHTTLSVYEEGAIEHILRAKIWLYDFKSFFWQALIEFLFVVYFLFFLQQQKKMKTDKSL